MTNQQLWQATLGELELVLSKPSFVTWFKQTFISSFENNTIIVGVPNSFAKKWLENKYHGLIINTLRKLISNQTLKVAYKIELRPEFNDFFSQKTLEAPAVLLEAPPTDEVEITVQPQNIYGLNPKYTLDSFVVGKGNELAHAACLAVIDTPGELYNPLFIYGGVGRGKTHLIQAVGHAFLREHPSKKVLYVTSETFTNEYIKSVKEGRANDFKDKYRNVDLLLIDDIQFISGKEGTQESFFHTFNELHQTNKQIVLTSDKPPKAIPALEDRLRSRFEWGMIADISNADLETRIAILQTKCITKNYNLSADIVEFLASNIQENIRELEGALNKIIAHHQLNNLTPNIDSVKNLLESLLAAPAKKILSPKQIIKIVAEYFHINENDILGASREKKLVGPRQIIMYLMRTEFNTSFPNIGQELGGRDHTTAMHACLKIENRVKNNQENIKQTIEAIKEKMFS